MKKIRITFIFVLALALVLYVFHSAILRAAGRYLGPTSAEHVEAAVIEGAQIVEKSLLAAGARLLEEGIADRITVVLQQPTREAAIPLLPHDYPELVRKELQRIGVPAGKAEVISVPIESHPVTLSEARFVTARLSQLNFRRVILVTEGFHSRRSYTLYKQEGRKYNLHVVPYSFFGEYNIDSWWTDKQGISDFLSETFKLAYYIVNGYISFAAL